MSSIRRHEARLRATFRRVLLVSLGVPAALQACGGDDAASPSPDGGLMDATTDRTLSDSPGLSDSMTSSDSGAADSGAPTDASLDASSGDSGVGAGDAANSDSPSSDAALDADGGPMGMVTCDDASRSAPYFADASPDAAVCYYFVDFSCPLYPTRGSSTCNLSATDCLDICTLDGGFFDCVYPYPYCTLAGLWIAEAGAPVTVACGLCPGVGRRPSGLRASSRSERARTQLGAYFARASRLEAASVFAFERLERELRAYRAPARLVLAARRAALDEVRHARVTAGLARRFGGVAKAPRARALGIRRLELVARENAVEGCVRETFGALVATWQAASARDEGIRSTMARIATDETRHAALAWAVAEWAEGQLGPAARGRIARARKAAVGMLTREVAGWSAPLGAGTAGLPDTRELRALASAMADAWAA